MTPRTPGRTERRGRPEGGGQTGRTGRRGGDSGTREAILDAARKRFAAHGYGGATIRRIAADARVDPALVHHFFGSKERLFAAAVRLPVVPGELISSALVLTALAAWDIAEIRDTFLGLLRSAATSEQALIMLREFVTEAIVGRLSSAAHTADPVQARYRAALVASQVVGLAIARQVLGLEPLAQAGRAELAAAVGPTLDRYLSGDLG